MNKKIIIFCAILFGLISPPFIPYAQATVFFHYDAESGTSGDLLPWPASSSASPPAPEFYQGDSANPVRGRVQADASAPQGNKFFQWLVADHDHDAWNEIREKGVGAHMPVHLVMGNTYYVAYYFRYDRTAGEDLWHTTTSGQSEDKGIELYGGGFRWELSPGQWEVFPPLGAGHFTCWIGNASHHLNNSAHTSTNIVEVGDAITFNQQGYTRANPMSFDYERWYSVVMGIKAATTQTGSVAVWINGVKVAEYNNIYTVSSSNPDPTIEQIWMNGTFAQGNWLEYPGDPTPGYDIPTHTRKFDDLMLTDSWQDIVNEGYLADPNASAPATCTSFTYSSWTPSTCPSNGTQTRIINSSSPAGCIGGSPVLSQSCTYVPPVCTESWSCSAWSAWSTTCTNNSQSHTRTCTDANSCGTTTSKPAETESQSCTVTYNLTNLTQLIADWLETKTSTADLNSDSKVNSQDLGIMMSNWN